MVKYENCANHHAYHMYHDRGRVIIVISISIIELQYHIFTQYYHSNYHMSSSGQSEVKLVYHTLPHICNLIIFVVLEFECDCVLVIYHGVH